MHAPDELQKLAEGEKVEPTTTLDVEKRWWGRPDLDKPDGD